MLQLKQITKDYVVADTKVKALKGVDISFRKTNSYPFWDLPAAEKRRCLIL